MRVEARASGGRAWEVKGRPGSFSATSLQSFFCLRLLVVSPQLPSAPLVPLLLPVCRSLGYLVLKFLSPSLLMAFAFVSLWVHLFSSRSVYAFFSSLLCGCLCLPVCCFSHLVSVCVRMWVCMLHVCVAICVHIGVCMLHVCMHVGVWCMCVCM